MRSAAALGLSEGGEEDDEDAVDEEGEGEVYPSHVLPVEVQRTQLGLPSSHRTLRILPEFMRQCDCIMKWEMHKALVV